jgi:hypothetical protein
MVIALADVMHSRGVNPQQQLHVTAIDVGERAAHMADAQLSLLHIPAVVYVGNTLSMEMRDVWYTPAHILGGWGPRLRYDHLESFVQVLARAAGHGADDPGHAPDLDGFPTDQSMTFAHSRIDSPSCPLCALRLLARSDGGVEHMLRGQHWSQRLPTLGTRHLTGCERCEVSPPGAALRRRREVPSALRGSTVRRTRRVV